jgi:hypothetical protein
MALPSFLVRRDSHDYYGHSVPMRLSPGRGSHVPSRWDVRAQRRCLTHHLNEASLAPILPVRVLGTATFFQVRKGSGFKRSARGRVLASSVIEVRAILLSPYCAERSSPEATTLWSCARFHGRLLSPFPFGIRSAGVPRISLKF